MCLSNHLGISNTVKFIDLVYESENAQLSHFAKVFALTSYTDIHQVTVEEQLCPSFVSYNYLAIF